MAEMSYDYVPTQKPTSLTSVPGTLLEIGETQHRTANYRWASSDSWHPSITKTKEYHQASVSEVVAEPQTA
jgi:hypothetical protein